MIFELLGHVAEVVRMRNTVPCGISNAKGELDDICDARIQVAAKWYSLAWFLEQGLRRARQSLITIYVTQFSRLRFMRFMVQQAANAKAPKRQIAPCNKDLEPSSKL